MKRAEALVALMLVLLSAWVVATTIPAWSEVVWAGAVLLIFVAALATLTARAERLRPAGPSAFESLLTDPHRVAPRPADLERLERLVGWRAYSQHDFDHRLRPLLVQLIAGRLQMARRIEFDDAGTVERFLSSELSAMIAPSGSHNDRSMPITTEDLARVLDEIEAL
ncbi:MAG: hypothetical protein M3P18_21315 [Actinomycetota bacterium]|nr:hypothetical protein [Actinomycetota bacterium]